ncbi:MAG: fimbria/pilus outer membrane usher protein, partial [Aeromonadaceae bacterium]
PLQSLQLGYSNNIGVVSYQLGVQHNQDSTGEEDQIYTLSLSMPLGNRSSLNMQLNHDPHNGNQMQSSLTGVAGEASELSYGITATHDASNEQGLTSVGGNASYRSSAAYLSGSTSRDSNHQQQYSLGLRGAVVAHSGGVIATPDLGDTFAIVEAPAAEGAGVANRQGNHIDSSGYAIVPYLTPFENNHLDLDPQGMAETVELTSTSQSVIPDAGAAIKVTFPTRVGYGLLLDTRLTNGQSAPFGAQVLDHDGHEIGSVGQGGQLYARVSQKTGNLTVRWGKQADQRCQISYQLPQQATGLTTLPDTHLCLTSTQGDLHAAR